MRPMFKLPDQREEISTGNKKKNTRQWCKGKVGVKHDPVWRIWTEACSVLRSDKPLVYACVKCQKQIDHWFPHWDWTSPSQRRPRPEIGSREPLK